MSSFFQKNFVIISHFVNCPIKWEEQFMFPWIYLAEDESETVYSSFQKKPLYIVPNI